MFCLTFRAVVVWKAEGVERGKARRTSFWRSFRGRLMMGGKHLVMVSIEDVGSRCFSAVVGQIELPPGYGICDLRRSRSIIDDPFLGIPELEILSRKIKSAQEPSAWLKLL